MAKAKEPEPGNKILKGLSLDKILSDIGSELKHQAQHGAHETAAALFHGSAFVMYPHEGQNQDQQTSNDQASQHGLPDHTQQHEMER